MNSILVRVVVPLSAMVALSACANGDGSGRLDSGSAAAPGATIAELDAVAPDGSATSLPPTPPADSSSDNSFSRDLALPPAKDLDELAAAVRSSQLARPVTLSIDRIGLERTAVVSVGVENNGEMEVPGPREIGWYRFGPEPGQPGSAVLAAHIASGGIDGAFRHLDQMEPGDVVHVDSSDGATQSFVVTDVIQVDKTELPFDEMFARSGPPRLALITCGGPFDYQARSYQDNIVVVASLLDEGGDPAA